MKAEDELPGQVQQLRTEDRKHRLDTGLSRWEGQHLWEGGCHVVPHWAQGKNRDVSTRPRTFRSALLEGSFELPNPVSEDLSVCFFSSLEER